MALASLHMAHVVMKRKRPYTELESVVLSCLEIAADTLRGGKKPSQNKENSFIRQQILFSDNTIERRCDRISEIC